MATRVPMTLKRPGLIAVAPSKAAEIARSMKPAPVCGLALPFFAMSSTPATPARVPEATKVCSVSRSTLSPTRRAAPDSTP